MNEVFMKNAYLIWCLFVCSTPLFGGASRTEVQVSADDDEDYYEQDSVIWIGPGWYYGMWFGNEGDFNNYNHYHHHNHEPYDHHDGHHGGDHHGGGGDHRRGGGHPGGGHGGGHR